MKTKQILLTFLALLISTGNLCYSQEKKVTKYCYITATRNAAGLEILFTDLIAVQRDADNDTYTTDVELEFNDALKNAYPQTYFEYKNVRVWIFDKVSDAEKDKRETLGKYKTDGWNARYFRFTFYGDK